MVDRPSPILSADYPYYRDAVHRWAGKIAKIAELGATHVSCYVPWRMHEYRTPDGGLRTDFVGASGEPRRNVVAFLNLVATYEMKAILRPGPFTHGEIMYGGLPDRIAPPEHGACINDSKGQPVRCEGMPLPDPLDPKFLDAAEGWLNAFRDGVLAPLEETDVVDVVQLGNEGLLSDANSEHGGFLRPGGSSLDAAAYRDFFERMARSLEPLTPKLLFSFSPFPSHLSQKAKLDWLERTDTFQWKSPKELYGYTSWLGHPAQNRQAFSSLMLSAKRAPGYQVEENGGFLWDDSHWATPWSFAYATALCLGAGSTGICVYPFAATSGWGEEIAVNPAYLDQRPDHAVRYAEPYGDLCAVNQNGDKTHKFAPFKDYFQFLRRNMMLLLGETVSEQRIYGQKLPDFMSVAIALIEKDEDFSITFESETASSSTKSDLDLETKDGQLFVLHRTCEAGDFIVALNRGNRAGAIEVRHAGRLFPFDLPSYGVLCVAFRKIDGVLDAILFEPDLMRGRLCEVKLESSAIV